MAENFSGRHSRGLNITPNDIILLFNRSSRRDGSEELQLMLIGECMQFLSQGEIIPANICFNTDGIKMVVDGSHVLGHLLALE